MLASGVDGLPVEHGHALVVYQAMLEKLPVVSTSPSTTAYEVEWIDATTMRTRRNAHREVRTDGALPLIP